MRADNGFQLPISQILEPQINAEFEVATRLRVADQRQILDHTATVVLENPLATTFTTQPLVVGQLDTFLTAFIDIRKPDHMSCHLSSGIVTTVLLAAVNTRNTHCQHLPSNFWLKLTAQVNKLAARILTQPLAQPGLLKAQQARDIGQSRLIRVDLGRIRPDGLDWSAHRQ